MKKFFIKNFTWVVYWFITFISILIFFFLIWGKPPIVEDKLVALMNILINSISISVGFFGAIFTFIFSLKENPIINKIMHSTKTKKQFKYMNYGIVASGFVIILLVLMLLVFDTVEIKFSIPFLTVDALIYFTLSLSLYFYCMFATYLYVISNIVFQKKNASMTTKINPPLKRK